MKRRWSLFVALGDEDLAPRIVAWTVSILAGAVWLAVVHLTPVKIAATIAPPVASGSEIDFYEARPVESSGGSKERTRSIVRPPRIPGADVAQAFAASIVRKVTKDVSALISGVEAVSAITTSALASDKTVLSERAEPGTPGAAKFGDGTEARNVGTVGQTSAIRRAEVRIAPLKIVATPLARGPSIDPTEAAAFVRSRAAQLQYCYARATGAAESDLGGVVTLRLQLGPNGAVREAAVVARTWSGPAATEVEQCVVGAAKSWRVPAASDGSTLTLPISFTRSR